MKNRAIEIHDSILDDICVRNAVAALHFSSAYVHESSGDPGVDAGSGWLQGAMLRISDPVVRSSFPQLPTDLLDGQIVLDGAVSQNTIPVPLHHKGTVELRLESSNDEALVITGSGADLEMLGDPTYVEEFLP